jgi:hypothetical protein
MNEVELEHEIGHKIYEFMKSNYGNKDASLSFVVGYAADMYKVEVRCTVSAAEEIYRELDMNVNRKDALA